MVTVDAIGNLSQHNKPMGTLRELMGKVQATNAVMAQHHVPEEFVISVATPMDPTVPGEVKILARKPDPSSPGAVQQHAPVEPTSASEAGAVVDIGVGGTNYAREVGGEVGDIVKTEHGAGYADPAMIRRDLTWKHAAPRTDVDSVLVLGDALQTLPMMFGEHSVKRMFINNINAEYAPGGPEYRQLALGLRNVMTSGGRVEVQWTTSTEITGGVERERGHITGEALRAALDATAALVPRAVDGGKIADPVTDYRYSVEAPRTESGIPSKSPPADPVPEHRWIFTFGE